VLCRIQQVHLRLSLRLLSVLTTLGRGRGSWSAITSTHIGAGDVLTEPLIEAAHAVSFPLEMARRNFRTETF